MVFIISSYTELLIVILDPHIQYSFMFKKSDLLLAWKCNLFDSEKFYEQNSSLFAQFAIRCLGFAWLRAARRSGARERDHMAEEMRYLEISFKQRSPMKNVAKIFIKSHPFVGPKLFWFCPNILEPGWAILDQRQVQLWNIIFGIWHFSLILLYWNKYDV